MRRRAATLALICAMVTPSLPAFAVPDTPASPAPTPSPSATASPNATTPPRGPVPSQAQVEAARAAVARAQAQQARVEARWTAAQRELDDLEAAAQLATERYNQARVQLAQRAAAAKKARQEAAAATERSGQARTAVDNLAATLYMQGGPLAGFDVLFGLAAGSDAGRTAGDLDAISAYRGRTFDDAQAAAAKAQEARRVAAQAELQQKAAQARAKEAHDAAQAAVAQGEARQQAIGQQMQAAIDELATLRDSSAAVERARLDGLAAQSVRQQMLRSQSATLAADGFDPGTLPAADSDAAAAAIAYAQEQLGKPYRWGGEGPDSFDCSGLTMRAWQAAGKNLIHYTGSQYQQTARVPISDLAPGDLVFFGKDAASIHHVGLYVGDGRMIEAPRTGLNIRYSSIYRSSLLPYGGRV